MTDVSNKVALICLTGGTAGFLSSPAAQNNSLYLWLKSLLSPAPFRTRQRGVRVVTDVERGMRWMRRRHKTNDAEAYGEAVWS
jgi:hypothetical protein